MNCSRCHASDTKVIESREVAGGKSIRRRRMCAECTHRFTTYERVERPQLIVIKNNDVREIFNRDKLLGGLYRACEKTSVTSLQLEQLVSDVETQLYEQGDSEVNTSRIGELVMEQLAGLNEVAYVRFASVYRRFKDIASFEKELSDIRKKKDKIL
ncbi:MAG TPA: transcriptional regulator NrdR [Patescibacteria group bacterium]|nr:transcriptional regulator NrdR [Patescibacteria group bacterium]